MQRRTRGSDLVDHRCVVARLERRRRHQQADRRLVQHVLQLMGPVGRVDVHQDRTDPGRRVLDEDPLRAVGRPDPDPIAPRDALAQQRRGDPVDGRVQLRVRPPPPARDVDERLVVRQAGGGAAQVVTDRAADERHVTHTARIAQVALHVRPPGSSRRAPCRERRPRRRRPHTTMTRPSISLPTSVERKRPPVIEVRLSDGCVLVARAKAGSPRRT